MLNRIFDSHKYKRYLLCLTALTILLSLNTQAQDYAKFGQIALMRGNFKEAIFQLEKAIKISPNDVNILWMLGYSYYSDGDFVNAMQTFDKLVVISPTEIKAFYQRGKSRQKIYESHKNLSVLQKENLLQDIIADYSQSISLSRFASIELHQNRGIAYREYARLKIENKWINNSADGKSIVELLKKSNDDFKIILEMRPMRKDISDLLRLNLQMMRRTH